MLNITKTSFLSIFPVIGCCLLITTPSCHSSKQKQEAVVEQKQIKTPAATEVVSAKRGKLSSSIQVPGELIPYQKVEIYAKENSFVKKVLVDVGSGVKQGQLLVSMEAPEINSRISEAQSNLKSLQAIYISSKATYNRLLETSKT
ncbi:MAG: efflux RND transporter periplasmic adaptor subunit, partial [Segetibacter sp.]